MIEALSPARARDAVPELAALLVDAVRHGAEVSFMADIDQGQAEAFWHGVAQDVTAGHVLLYVARDDRGAILGTVQLHPVDKPNQPHRADVAKLLVHSRARRRGVGAALMLHLEEEMARLGRSLLTLDTASGSGGDALYRKLGYVEAGRIPNFALTPEGRPSEATFLYKHLR